LGTWQVRSTLPSENRVLTAECSASYNPAMQRLTLFLLAASLLAAQPAREVEITSEPHHHLLFTNDEIRVFRVEVAPHSETLMHWHHHDYIYVTLGAAEVVNAVKDKPPVTFKLQDGETNFLAAPFAHIARNLSDQPFRNVTVEILQDARLRQSPAKWDEQRGLDILQGGTREILWVKDGIRASEFELQPGGVVPSQPRSHPMLLVAVSDLDLFFGNPRVHDSQQVLMPQRHLRSGNVTWMPSGFQLPILNASQQKAKFVTLEFP
jgi:quercetin dioxygenase-like cupin family protein